jgi:hypothetical protein
LWIGNSFNVDWKGNVDIGGNGSINIEKFRADGQGVYIGDQTNYINIDSNGIQMTGSISFPNSSINSGAIKGLDDKINQATSNIKTYNISNMRTDLLTISNGKNGLFTWSKDGTTMMGLNANYINAGAISADRIGVGILNVTVGIKRGFSLYGDSSAGVSDNPAAWEEFGELVPTTGMVGTRITHGVRLAVNQKNLQGDNTG